MKNTNVSKTGTNFLFYLNHKYNLNLIGGHRGLEFSLPSRRTKGSRFWYDGYDKERQVFFEHDGVDGKGYSLHRGKYQETKDQKKELAAHKYLKSIGDSGWFIRYNQLQDKFSIKPIGSCLNKNVCN